MKEIEKAHAILKHKAEDFIVEEIGDKWHCKVSKGFVSSDINVSGEEKDFLWCEFEKKNLDHFNAIKDVSIQLEISKDDIGYAGSKDKVAWTVQRISIFKPNIEKLKKFNHEKIILKNFKWEKRKIKLGYLDSNHFIITLRNIEKKVAIKISNQIRKVNYFSNYFGEQRFGVKNNNFEIGKLILKKKFKEAAELIFSGEVKEEEALRLIKRLNRKNLLMYVHSVQSKIFNEILKRSLEEGLDFTKKGMENCLLVGYKSRFYNGRLGEIEQEVIKESGLSLEDFDLREISFLRMKGSYRKALSCVRDLKIEVEDDDEFSGSKKIILDFILPSGVYATTFLENYFYFD